MIADPQRSRNMTPADGRRWQIGITDHVQPPADLEQQAFPEADFHFLNDWRTGDAAADSWRRMDGLLVWHWPVDAETVALLDHCRLAVRYGVGYDLVDLAALAERGIPLANTPDYGTEEVADAACAMILAVQRQILAYDRECRTYRGEWQERPFESQQRTNRQTLGVIGVGRIGTAVVNRMKPFGFRLLGYDPYQPSGHEKAVGYERTYSLDELLAASDIVTVHCPLTDETRGMIDEGFLARMKPGASLVNTARGRVLTDLNCLLNALWTDHLAYACLDVLPAEPPADHPLLDAWRADADWLSGRLIVTPHCAYYSAQAWREMRTKAAETARLYLVDGVLRNRITE